MTETQITDLQFSTGNSLTEQLVRDGAPSLPEGYTYRLEIKHPTLADGLPERGPASVTARIGHWIGDEWVELVRFTEVTRAHLHGATIAACVHAREEWEIFDGG